MEDEYVTQFGYQSTILPGTFLLTQLTGYTYYKSSTTGVKECPEKACFRQELMQMIELLSEIKVRGVA
jgi:hypothetical protein